MTVDCLFSFLSRLLLDADFSFDLDASIIKLGINPFPLAGLII